MFTGIVQKIGTVLSLTASQKGGRMVVQCAPWERAYEPGESIAINGVCLSLVEAHADGLVFDVLQETFDRTNLGALPKGSRVNLERALRYGDALGGHLVSGHIDGTGIVQEIQPVGRDRKISIACSPALLAGIVFKGSIACDGISLTVADCTDTGFSVHIIPMTLNHTHWSGLKAGAAVNLEVDLIGKYAARALAKGLVPGSPKSWAELLPGDGE